MLTERSRVRYLTGATFALSLFTSIWLLRGEVDRPGGAAARGADKAAARGGGRHGEGDGEAAGEGGRGCGAGRESGRRRGEAGGAAARRGRGCGFALTGLGLDWELKT